MSKYRMQCCCCSGPAGTFEQHWNRDFGYSICPSCVAEQCATSTAEEIRMRYGQAGVNYCQPMVRKDGRRYKVLASAKSQAQADAFLARTPGAVVLLVLDDGTRMLTDSRDEGEPAQAQAVQAA